MLGYSSTLARTLLLGYTPHLARIAHMGYKISMARIRYMGYNYQKATLFCEPTHLKTQPPILMPIQHIREGT